MTDMEIVRRLERLERDYRRMKTIGVTAAVMVAALGLMAARRPVRPQAESFPLDPLEALQLSPPQQQLPVPFRVFKTANLWNQLLLNTMDGRVWQIAFTVDRNGVRALVPINSTPLVTGKDALVGRFTLYPTDNIWTFLLVDQFSGEVWQCQFGIEDGYRWLKPINLASQGSR